MKHYLPICLLLLSFSAHGALTKWVDADGKVHYSDEPPPPNAKAKTLATPSVAAPASGVPTEKSVIEREAEWRKAQKVKEEAEQKAAKRQEESLAKQKNCEAASSNLKALENSPNIVTYNSKGEGSYMDESTRQKNIEEARKQVSSYCN